MRMYVFVRKDLPPTYRMVQGAHALAEFAFKYPFQFKKWGNSTIVFLKAKDENDILSLEQDLNYFKSCFTEPDIGFQKTAIACYAPENSFPDRKII